MDRRDHTVRCAGLNLHVADWGDAGGWPVLMLHGIRSFADTFEGLAGALQPGYRVLALDHRGRGQSDWDPGHNYYTDAYVQDVRAVAEQLGLSRFDLLGHSMGGINAIVYAAAHPDRVRRLVVEDAGPGAFDDSDGARRIRAELSRTPESFADWGEAEAFMREIRPTVTPEAIAARLRHGCWSRMAAACAGAMTMRASRPPGSIPTRPGWSTCGRRSRRCVAPRWSCAAAGRTT